MQFEIDTVLIAIVSALLISVQGTRVEEQISD